MRDAQSAGRATERKPHPRQAPDPTPEEIAERAAEIRAETWAKRAAKGKYETETMQQLRQEYEPRVHRLVIAKSGDRM